MKKYFLAALMIAAATMSVNAENTVKPNDMHMYDDVFEHFDDTNNDNVLAFYNKNANVESKTTFYMFALDRFYATHKHAVKKNGFMMAGYKKALKEAYQNNDEKAMKCWCHAMEDNFKQAISEAAEALAN